MGAATVVAVAGLAAGAIGGAMAAKKGKQGESQTTSFAPATAQERKLQKLSMDQYMQSLNQINQDQGYINQLDPMRQQALGIYQQGLDGSLTASDAELAGIDKVRQAQIQLGTQDINQYLRQAIGQTGASAGVRGLRGQALGALQGQNTQMAAQQIGGVVNQAGLQAAQQAYLAPQQRLQLAQGGMSYVDQLRQQAMQNRVQAQNPALLGLLQRERTQTTATPDRPGSGTDIMGGLFSGAAGGFGAAGQGFAAFKKV